MSTFFFSVFFALRAGFRTRAALQTEVFALRHQLLVLQRANDGRRVRLRATDRILWVWLSRLWAGWRSALVIRARPTVSQELRDLIRRMGLVNPRWGVPRIHGELLKLGIQVSQATVAKYMGRHRKLPSQTWRIFLKNHMEDLVAADFFVVPTVTFRVLFVFVILAHNRRRPVHFAVTANPTAEWTAQELLEAFPWDSAPRYLLRDRDGSYGEKFQEATRGLGIREVLTAPRSPWQNPYVERLNGSIRRECLEHVIVVNESSLRRVLKSYLEYIRLHSYAFGSRQGCAGPTECPAARNWQNSGATAGWRTPPSIRAACGLNRINFRIFNFILSSRGSSFARQHRQGRLRCS